MHTVSRYFGALLFFPETSDFSVRTPTVGFFQSLTISIFCAYLLLTPSKGTAMSKAKLTKSAVEKLPVTDSDQVYWDTELRGFGVRVKPSGIKSYIVQYRDRKSGASRRKTLGKHGPLLTLNQAKGIAKGILADAMRGTDPVQEMKIARQAPTVADLAVDYMEKHAIPKKRRQSIKNDQSMLDRLILPALGKRRVVDIRFQDIQTLHNRHAETPYQANRMLSLLSKMFSLSIRWGWRTDNPAKGIERYHEAPRDRWLSETELSRLANALDRHPNQKAADAVRLQLLTGARIGEVKNAKWIDFDFERGFWTKPSHHTKQKRTEHLPLSAAAIGLLESMRQHPDAHPIFLFPGKKDGQPIVDLKKFWRSILKAAEIDDYRVHDNRHTHASYLVSEGISLAVVGLLLGHTNPLTTQRYAHLADNPLRIAADVIGHKWRALDENG